MRSQLQVGQPLSAPSLLACCCLRACPVQVSQLMGWGCGKDTVLNSGAVGGGRAQLWGGLCLEEGGQEALTRASAGGSLHAYHLGPVV